MHTLKGAILRDVLPMVISFLHRWDACLHGTIVQPIVGHEEFQVVCNSLPADMECMGMALSIQLIIHQDLDLCGQPWQLVHSVNIV